jgi:hypothetical protein
MAQTRFANSVLLGDADGDLFIICLYFSNLR